MKENKETVVLQSFFKVSEDLKKEHKNLLQLQDVSVVPQESEFVRVPFRLLSAHIVGAWSWKATDFSNEALLQGSMNLLEGQPVYLDHDLWSVNKAVGVIESVSWQSATTDEEGNQIPAGINGVLKIDGATNPKIARAILTNPPIIQGGSVSIEYEYVASHAFDNKWEFWDQIGTLAEDGRMITREVTNILAYHEYSLVSIPADPMAKKITEGGTPYKPNMNDVFTFSKLSAENKEAYKKNQKYFVTENSFQMDKPYNKENFDAIEKKHQTEIQRLQGEKSALREEFEKELGNLNDVNKGLQSQRNEINAQKEAIEIKLKKANSELEGSKELLEFSQKIIKEKKEEVKRKAKLGLSKEKFEKIESLIDEADLSQLDAYMEMYDVSLLDKFGGHCKSCGGTEISFQSSEDAPPSKEKEKTKGGLSGLFKA